MDGEICHNSTVPLPTLPLECAQKFYLAFFLFVCLFVEQHGNNVLLYNSYKYMHIKE